MPDQSTRPAPWKDYRKYAFPLLWVVILGVLFLLRETLAPFIGALLIAYLLAPLVTRLNRLHIKGKSLAVPRWVGVLLIYAVLGLAIWGYGALAVPKIGAEFGKLAKEGEKLFLSLTPEKIEEYVEQARTWVEESGLPVHIVTPEMEDGGEPQPGFVLNLDEVIRQSVHDLTDTLRSNFFAFLTLGPRFAVKTFRFILMTFLVFMVAAFLLSNPHKPLSFMRSLFPQRLHGGYDEVVREIDTGLAGVVRGQVLICLVNGVLTFIGMIILGVKFPVMLSTHRVRGADLKLHDRRGRPAVDHRHPPGGGQPAQSQDHGRVGQDSPRAGGVRPGGRGAFLRSSRRSVRRSDHLGGPGLLQSPPPPGHLLEPGNVRPERHPGADGSG